MNKLLNNIREVVLKLNRLKYCGYDIHPAAKISLGVRIDKSYPKGIHIGTIKEVVNTKNITDRYAMIETAVDFSKLETVLVIK